MKILFCSRTDLSKELGASKVLIELAEEMEQLGWRCTLVSPKDIEPGLNGTSDYCVHLRRYLIEHAREYDVVEYDHGHLPYPRSDFPAETLFVARSVLLAHHFKHISIQPDKTIKGRVRSLLFDNAEAQRLRLRIEKAHKTVSEADLVNVVNSDDYLELVGSGVSEEKIVVIPYGLNRKTRVQFDSLPEQPPLDPVVVFVGTFDNRKGALDFPLIIRAVSTAVPQVRFRLLGTGMDQASVRKRLPKTLRSKVDVVSSFRNGDLPELLSGGSIGVFPSRLESFGLGILEMMAASIPVIAYNCPGPPAILSDNFLVPSGNWPAMSEKVIEFLLDRNRLIIARRWAKQRSQEFVWASAAKRTSDTYIKHLKMKTVLPAEVCSPL
jgi:glycosyltransferase involved in cell wall biosynthesis